MKIYKNIFLLIPLLLTGCQSPTDNNENNGGDENENYIIWGTGFNFFPNMMISPIFEVSGEAPLHTTHAENNFLSSPFRLTPGLRIHLH